MCGRHDPLGGISPRRLRSFASVDHISPGGHGPVVDPPLPEVDLRWRVSGQRLGDAEFLEQGRNSMADAQRALAVVGRTLASFDRVLDFGCGCARVTRHVLTATDAEVHGCDIDAEAIAWCQANLPRGHFVHNDDLPPLPYPDEHFDLIVNHSVFTHLPEDFQDRWLSELRRVVQPGGYLLLTVAGVHAFAGLREQYLAWPADPSAIEGTFYRSGFLYIADDGWSGTVFPDWYHSTFHSPTYVIEHWAQYFDVVALLPRGALNFLDMVVLHRRAAKPGF